jgi:mannose-6-phosphate isomerase-like protein (cupin superfamily)
MAKAKRKAKATKAKAKRSTKKVAANAKRTKGASAANHTKPRKPQRFTFSHHREEDFDQGLRTYAKYRDLGIAPATGGMVQAHVIRLIPPFRPEEVSTPHYHDVDFQMVYVLKGWIKSEFEGQGAHTFYAGSCWIQPPKIKHTVLGYSDDCELLEIVLPADFETVTLE